MWYTLLNPMPKRPVLPICVRFTESPTRLIDAKSSWENTASLKARSAGPWKPASFSYARES